MLNGSHIKITRKPPEKHLFALFFSLLLPALLFLLISICCILFSAPGAHAASHRLDVTARVLEYIEVRELSHSNAPCAGEESLVLEIRANTDFVVWARAFEPKSSLSIDGRRFEGSANALFSRTHNGSTMVRLGYEGPPAAEGIPFYITVEPAR